MYIVTLNFIWFLPGILLKQLNLVFEVWKIIFIITIILDI